MKNQFEEEDNFSATKSRQFETLSDNANLREKFGSEDSKIHTEDSIDELLQTDITSEFETFFSDFSATDSYGLNSGFYCGNDDFQPPTSSQDSVDGTGNSRRNSIYTEQIDYGELDDVDLHLDDHEADYETEDSRHISDFRETDTESYVDIFFEQLFEFEVNEKFRAAEQESHQIWSGNLESLKPKYTDRARTLANSKATVITDNLDCGSLHEMEKAIDYFYEFFLAFKHPQTFRQIHKIAQANPTFNLLQSVIELRTQWDDSYGRYRYMSLSWANAYRFCLHMQHFPLDEYCIFEWYEQFQHRKQRGRSESTNLELYYDPDDFLEERIPFVSTRYIDSALGKLPFDNSSDDLNISIDWYF